MPLTQKRDLRTNRTVWQEKRLSPIARGALNRDIKCDALVVGAGISGAIIAEALSDAGLSVVIVDRRGPLLGSTPASTALLQYEVDTPLSLLGKQIGIGNAERIWRRSRLALDALRERSRRLGIDAEQQNRDTLYLSGNVLDRAGLEAERDARARAGFEQEFLGQAEVMRRYGIKGRSALLSFDNLAADPRKLAAGFLNAAIEHGARLYAPVEVTNVEASKSGIIAATAHGPTIACQHLVFATGYEMPKIVPAKGNKITSTWVIATKKQPRAIWPTGCFIWEAADPYLYIRTTSDGRVICGGEDAAFEDEERRDALLPEKTQRLERKLGQLLPMIDASAEFAWCGSFGDSSTSGPTIGAVPRHANCYAALGYGGNGITFSMMAGQILSGLISGRGDADADLFSFAATNRFAS